MRGYVLFQDSDGRLVRASADGPTALSLRRALDDAVPTGDHIVGVVLELDTKRFLSIVGEDPAE